jgi:hypothetical protein
MICNDSCHRQSIGLFRQTNLKLNNIKKPLRQRLKSIAWLAAGSAWVKAEVQRCQVKKSKKQHWFAGGLVGAYNKLIEAPTRLFTDEGASARRFTSPR